MWLASIVLSMISMKVTTVMDKINYFAFRQNNLFMYFTSICFFLYVVGMKPMQNEKINRIAKHVLPCYLIQSNIFFSNKIGGYVDSIMPRVGISYPTSAIGITLALTVVFMGVDVLISGAEKKIRTLFK